MKEHHLVRLSFALILACAVGHSARAAARSKARSPILPAQSFHKQRSLRETSRRGWKLPV